MGRVLMLALIIVLALASVAGFLILTRKIAAGERQVADGQRQLGEGQVALEAGKARLDSGKRELSQGKKAYKQAGDNPLAVLADKALKGGKGFKEAGKRLAEGDTQVAAGEGRVNAGEQQLGAGESELRRGKEQLRLAKGARIACALGAVLFAALAIVLGFGWRRSLARVSTRTDA